MVSFNARIERAHLLAANRQKKKIKSRRENVYDKFKFLNLLPIRKKMSEYEGEKKLDEATTMRRKGSDGGKMAAPTK